MPRHIEAYLDGVPISSLGPFLIQAVHEDPPTVELTEGDRPGRSGTMLLSSKRQSLKVTIEIAIRELYDLQARSHYMERLSAWATGKVLQLSSRPDRRLNVVCTAPPSLGPVRDCTATVRVELTAYTIPFWEDETPTVWSVENSLTGSLLPIIPGSAETPVCLSVKPKSAALTAFSATVAGETIALSGLSVATSATLEFGRDAVDNLAVYSGSTPLLSKRTAESADDLFAGPGKTTFAYSANTAVDVTIYVRGRWR